MFLFRVTRMLSEDGRMESAWINVNNVPFGKMFQQPAGTRWEQIGTACCVFVHRVEGFRKVALGVTNVEYSQYQRNKVASDVFSLVQEPVLVSMSHFLSAYHNN